MERDVERQNGETEREPTLKGEEDRESERESGRGRRKAKSEA